MSKLTQAGAAAGAPEHATDADIETQRAFWNEWNATTRELRLDRSSHRQKEVILEWMVQLHRVDLDIMEVGCGAGWMIPSLRDFGRVTATDVADDVLQRVQARNPGVRCLAGDFMELDFGRTTFDVVVCLEVLSHVADQAAFLEKIAGHLRPGGVLMIATQNRTVMEKYNRIKPPKPGNLRKWYDADELRELLSARFAVRALFSVTPMSNRGLMRIVHSNLVNTPIRWVFGNRIDRLKERMGLGWTLMALAQKPM